MTDPMESMRTVMLDIGNGKIANVTFKPMPEFDNPLPVHTAYNDIDAINEINSLYDQNLIDSDKYISLTRMVLSKDKENYNLVKAIINQLNPKKS